jgi:hypothetical protein
LKTSQANRGRLACLLGMGSGAVVIGSLLLPWYRYETSSESAFELFSRADIYLLCLAVIAIALAAVNLFVSQRRFPLLMQILGGLVLGAPLFLRLEAGFSSDAFDEVRLGLYLTLAAGVGLLGAGILGFEARSLPRASTEGGRLIGLGLSWLRWAALGLALGVAGTLAASTFIDTDEPSFASLFHSYPDLNDASRAADKWAAAHRRPGEPAASNDGCEAGGGVFFSSYFVCWQRFGRTGRRVTIYLEPASRQGKLEVAVVRVRRGKRPFPSFP